MNLFTKATQLTTLSLLATLTAAPALSESVLFQDDFSGLSTDALDATTPDVTQNATAWVASAEYAADGTLTSGAASRRAYLALGGLIDDNRGSADAIYTLSASYDVAVGTSGLWEGVGFWSLDSPLVNFATVGIVTGEPDVPRSGNAWMLRRDNQQIRTFLGLGTANGVAESTATPNNIAGPIDIQIILDLSDWNGTDNFGSVVYNAKLSSLETFTEIASGELDATNSTFRSVGFGGGAVDATITSFELTQVPEPSSLALLGLGGLLIARRRRG